MLARTLLLALLVLVLVQTVAFVTLLLRTNRQRRLPESFRCRTRQAESRGHRSRTAARSRLGWASWAHGVLLVHPGRLGRLDVLPVRFPEGAVTPIARETAKGLGPAPVVVLLRLDDGRLIELAAPTEARELVAGPFLAACVMAPDR